MLEINELRMVHEGGTKFYKVSLVISRSEGRAVLIKRWGKLAAQGEYKIEKYNSLALGQDAYYETVKGKQRRGYANDANHETTKIRLVTVGVAPGWVSLETAPQTALEIMSFLGEQGRGEIVEIVFEEPVKAKVPDRTGDENWASW